MKNEQLNQENQYNFPYHYIPQNKKGFTQNYNWSWGKQYMSAIEFILNEIKKEDHSIKTILDLGCGDGRLTKELSENFNLKKVTGIDYSNKAIQLAKALNPEINFINIDIINDNHENKYDAITLIEVFEHIPLELCGKFANSVPKLLNNKGIVYLTVPHKNKSLQDKHFQHFDYESLIKYFEKEFKIQDLKYIQKNDKFLVLLNKIMFNKFWIINDNFLNNLLYKFYKKRYFFASEKNCGRIYLKMIKKS